MAATWRDSEAALLEAKANAIEQALQGLERIDGMFDDRAELRHACGAAKDLLRVEEDNCRKKAERLAAMGSAA